MNRTKSCILIALAFLLIAFSNIGIFPSELKAPVETQENTLTPNPKASGSWDLTGTPIIIDNNWSDTRDAYEWCTGLGTEEQPYVIENVTIDGMQNYTCITITNTSDYFEIRNCTLYNTTSDWSSFYQYGIYTYKVDNGKILDCYLFQHDYKCILIKNESNVIIANNTFEEFFDCGVTVYCSDNISINFNNFTNGGYGVFASYNFDCDITHNRVINCYNGFNLQYWVVGNKINNTNYIAHNFLYNLSGYAIWLSYNNNNTVYDNEIIQCHRGITSRAKYNKIIKNTIINRGTTPGIKGIGAGDADLAYLNHIECPYAESEVEGGSNSTWNNGSIGNYYSQYKGKDANDDGIGDTPHRLSIHTYVEDPFPIWWDAPVISILEPNASDTFEHVPSFEISIDEGFEDAVWNTIDDGLTNFTITEFNGTIDNSAWSAASNGPIQLVVYANDSRGYIGNATVEFTRSVNPPDIAFTSPTPNQEFRVNPPSFTVTIDDMSLIVGKWYTIDGGANYYNFTGLGATVDNTAWNSTSEGAVALVVYAMDDLGNIGSKSITIMKNISSGPEHEPEPTDGTGQPISGYNAYIVMGIVLVISVIFIRKKRAR